jgi:hypothetical protein
LIFNQRHLLHALREYEISIQRAPALAGHRQRPATCPLPEPITDPDRLAHFNIHRRDRLGGIPHEYEHAA